MMLGQDLRQPVERALRPAGDDHLAAVGADVGDVLDHGIEHVDRLVGALLLEAAPGFAPAWKMRRPSANGASNGVSSIAAWSGMRSPTSSGET